MWPFTRKPEKRQGFTDSYILAVIAQAAGTDLIVEPEALGSIQSAMGFWGRSLAVASVSPERAAMALTRPVLYQIGTRVLIDGEACYEIQVRDGKPVLRPASEWEITGGTWPGNWQYRLTKAGPTDQITTLVPASRVFHVRLNPSSKQPHLGRSPLPSETLRLAAGIEWALANEAGAPSGYVLPAPMDAIGEADLEQLKSDLASLKGRASLVPSMRGGWGDGPSGAPSDWRPARIGAEPPEILRGLREDVGLELLAAAGIPPALHDTKSDATGRREALRQFLHVTLQPLGDLIAAEAQDKLHDETALSFEGLFASDVQGRARAFQSMVTGGMDVSKAAMLSGLMAADD